LGVLGSWDDLNDENYSFFQKGFELGLNVELEPNVLITEGIANCGYRILSEHHLCTINKKVRLNNFSLVWVVTFKWCHCLFSLHQGFEDLTSMCPLHQADGVFVGGSFL
jgi:hypothetical protein